LGKDIGALGGLDVDPSKIGVALNTHSLEYDDTSGYTLPML